MESSGQHLSREDWILEALKVMDREGIHGVKISALAESLGVTKGSFYWHFKSREDLLAGILSFWAESLVAQIDAEVALQPDDPADELGVTRSPHEMGADGNDAQQVIGLTETEPFTRRLAPGVVAARSLRIGRAGSSGDERLTGMRH